MRRLGAIFAVITVASASVPACSGSVQLGGDANGADASTDEASSGDDGSRDASLGDVGSGGQDASTMDGEAGGCHGTSCASDDAGEAGDGGAGCHSEADCSGLYPGAYCQAPGGPFPIAYALVPCTTDGACSSDSGVATCGSSTCVCQSTQYSPRPPPYPQWPGLCEPPCITDADCSAIGLNVLYGDGTDFVCDAGGHCVPKSCTSPLDCGPEFDCTANQCVRRSCTTDTDCSPSGACVNGACRTSAGTCAPGPV